VALIPQALPWDSLRKLLPQTLRETVSSHSDPGIPFLRSRGTVCRNSYRKHYVRPFQATAIQEHFLCLLAAAQGRFKASLRGSRWRTLARLT